VLRSGCPNRLAALTHSQGRKSPNAKRLAPPDCSSRSGTILRPIEFYAARTGSPEGDAMDRRREYRAKAFELLSLAESVHDPAGRHAAVCPDVDEPIGTGARFAERLRAAPLAGYRESPLIPPRRQDGTPS